MPVTPAPVRLRELAHIVRSRNGGPFTPGELDPNEAYGFVLYHVMAGASMTDILRIEARDVGGVRH
jgi:hypothetical protein